ncbi:NUDIX hydrolase [Candidatus Micrarchaeota archaeon]|nr:NUDIX hydrolase [Candidatus Micrarchaeota archaeon]MBU1930432.1 NUDIX hydrolase [Candidatus Micrarchaeota archaeon]
MASVLKEIFNWTLNRVLKNKYPFPTVDAVIKYSENGKFKGLVLVERKFPPYGWAFPGGFVEQGESLETAVAREAIEETGLKIKIEKQFHTYSQPKRDPRIHTISTVFICSASGKIKRGSDAKNARVFALQEIPKLCFDHADILADLKKAGEL